MRRPTPAADKGDATELLLGYINAASESSKRVRRVLVVLVVATTIEFFANWNSRDDGWIRSRLAVEEDVLRWWSLLDSLTRTRANPPLVRYADPRMTRRLEQAHAYYRDRVNAGDAVDSARIAQEA